MSEAQRNELDKSYCSECCHARVKVSGGKDGTQWYECESCGKPCNFFEVAGWTRHSNGKRGPGFMEWYEPVFKDVHADKPWNGIDPDQFVRSVRDGSYNPNVDHEARTSAARELPQWSCSALDVSRRKMQMIVEVTPSPTVRGMILSKIHPSLAELFSVSWKYPTSQFLNEVQES